MHLDDYLKETLKDVEVDGGKAPPADDAISKLQAELTVGIQKIRSDMETRFNQLEKRYEFNEEVDKANEENENENNANNESEEN